MEFARGGSGEQEGRLGGTAQPRQRDPPAGGLQVSTPGTLAVSLGKIQDTQLGFALPVNRKVSVRYFPKVTWDILKNHLLFI